jgi:streptogramin lyase
VGVLDPLTGAVREFSSPGAEAAPYGIVVGPGGRIWSGDERNNHLLALDPISESMYTVSLPTVGAVVRNMAVDAERGRIWMVLTEAGALGRIDVARVGRGRRERPSR